MQIRLLTAADAHVLDRVAADDADFDIGGRGEDEEEEIAPSGSELRGRCPSFSA